MYSKYCNFLHNKQFYALVSNLWNFVFAQKIYVTNLVMELHRKYEEKYFLHISQFYLEDFNFYYIFYYIGPNLVNR